MCEYTCPVCGVTKSVRYEWEVRTYCSRSCAQKANEAKKRAVREICIDGECVFQPESIMCYKRNCTNCGWNPVVAKARLEKLGAEIPEPEPKTKDYFGDWISVETRLPKDRVQVLAYTQTGKIMSLHCKDGFWCAPMNIVVTHWMPMPNPPKE
jgi:hypothetical protein